MIIYNSDSNLITLFFILRIFSTCHQSDTTYTHFIDYTLNR